MNLQQRINDPAFIQQMSRGMASRFGPPVGASAAGPGVRTQQVQAPTMPAMPKPKSLTENLQEGKQLYDTGKQVYKYGKMGADKLGSLINPASPTASSTAANSINNTVSAVLPGSAPTGELASLMNPTSAAPSAAPGVGAVAGPAALVAAGAGALGEFDHQMGKGGYQALDKIHLNGVGGGDVVKAINPMTYLDKPVDGLKNLANVMTLGLFDNIF